MRTGGSRCATAAYRAAAIGLVVPVIVACNGDTPAAQPVPNPAVIAHRGASGHAPEHTYPSFDLALEMGADYIELDLQMTADSILVVLHDETLDRTARGPGAQCTGPVGLRRFEQLAACEVGSWFLEGGMRDAAGYEGAAIPTLDGVLERYGRTARYYIETKQPEAAPGMEERLVGLLERHRLLPATRHDRRVLVQSFSAASLRRLEGLHAELPMVQLLSRRQIKGPLDELFRDIATYAIGVGPERGAVTPALIAAAHQHGLIVHPYTVNQPADMTALLALGVDGMFTDFPDRLLELLGR